MKRVRRVWGRAKVWGIMTFAIFLVSIPAPVLAAGKGTDPKKVINTVGNAIIGVGVGIATVVCIANAIFTIVAHMSNQESHNRIELKEKLQHLVILEILALSSGGFLWWVNGLI